MPESPRHGDEPQEGLDYNVVPTAYGGAICVPVQHLPAEPCRYSAYYYAGTTPAEELPKAWAAPAPAPAPKPVPGSYPNAYYQPQGPAPQPSEDLSDKPKKNWWSF